MKNSRNALSVQLRAFIHVLRISPLAGILSLTYKLIEGLFPAYITAVSAVLFDTVAEYAKGTAEIAKVIWLGFLLIVGYGVKQLFQYISSITINAGVYEKVTSYSNSFVYKKCAELPLIEYEDSEMLDHKSRASQCVSREVLSQLYITNITMIMSAISVVSIIMILSSYSKLFLPISVLSVIPYFVARLIRGQEFYLLKRQQIKEERRKSYLWSLFIDKQSIKEMRVMGFGDYISQKWVLSRDKVNEEQWKLVKKDSMSLLLCDSIRILGYALCIILSFVLVINGQISVGIFSACISAFASVQSQTKSFLIELGNIPEKINYARDYFSFVDQAGEICSSSESVDSIKQICFYNVEFAYPNAENNAINQLSIAINAGDTIAIVGENGSGKTTFTKLLLGIYKPASGEVLVNGHPLQDVNEAEYMKKVSMISQQFVQYHLSLRENVAMSDLNASSDDLKIRQVLHDVKFDAPVSDLDAALGTEFGGVDLSGGQWQKLAIARGIFRDSELIVMDEPTSAIDPMAETEILRNFLNIAQGKTAIIVSHRTGLCTLVDKIAVMKKGRLVEFGSHEALLRQKGEYAKLYTAQQQWYI